MSFGTALAQGLAMGIGQGANQYFLDQRRDKMDAQKLARKFDNFKKETDYAASIQAEAEKRKQEYETQKFETQQEAKFELAKKTAVFEAGYADITQKTEKLGAWEKAAKMSTRDLVYQNALKASQNFSKGDRPAFIRDYMQRNSGITKTEALDMGGYTLPDYSQYVNNPDYADAIPKARLAGLQDMPGMDDMFQYTPPAEAVDVETTDMPQWKVEQVQRHDAYTQSITNNGSLIQQGITAVDPQVLNLIDTGLQYGKQDAFYVDGETGTEINRVDDEVIRGLRQGPNGEPPRLAVLDGTLMTATRAQTIQQLQAETEADEAMPDTEAAPMEAPTEAPELPQTTQEAAREQKQYKEETKRYRREAKEIGDTLAKENITGVVDAIQTAEDDLKALDPEEMDFVYSALNEAQGNPRLAIDYFRKKDDPKARRAAMAMQSLMGVLNVELKDRSGAAVTESEAQRFFAELGRASAVGSLEETLKGLTNLRNQKLSKTEGYLQGKEQGTVDEFFATSPKYAKYFEEHETYGTEEGKARGTTRTEIKQVASDLIEQGISAQEINAYLSEAYGEEAKRLGLELPTF